jgi:hypothetical protein
MTRPRTEPWTLAAVILALSVGAGLSWCIVASPPTLYDGLGPILDARLADSSADVFRSALHTTSYFRPLRVAQIKAVFDLSPENPIRAFKLVHVILTLAACLFFALLLRPGSRAEFVAAAVAIMVFIGHHSFFLLVAEAYPINHFLEMVVIGLAVAVMARGPARWWKGLASIALLACALMTLESGALIWVVAVASWLIGWRGISARALVACTLVLAAYVWLRVDVLAIGSPGLDERAAGFGLSRLEPDEIVARFGDNPWPFYAYNAGASVLDVLFSQPRQGTFVLVRRWIDGDVPPWMWMHIVSSLLVSLSLVAFLWPAFGRWRRGALRDGDRFVLLAFAVIAANSVISYGYVKDDVLSIAGAFYAAGAYAVFVRLEQVTSSRATLRVAAAVALVCASALWTSRAAGAFYSLRAFSYRTASDWARYSLERELPANAADAATLSLFLDLRRQALRYDVPDPHFTDERTIQRYVEIQ